MKSVLIDEIHRVYKVLMKQICRKLKVLPYKIKGALLFPKWTAPSKVSAETEMWYLA
jgi:hypothetical protein